MKELHVCLLTVEPDVLQAPCPSSSNFSVVLLLTSLPSIGSTKRNKGFHTDTGIHVFIVLQSCKYLPDIRGHKTPRRI